MSTAAPYLHRRQRLMAQLGSGIVILPTARHAVRNADTHYPYRPDSSFYYLTGFDEPEAVLVLLPASSQSILFCRSKDLEREIWDGYRHGPDGARAQFGFDQAYPLSELDLRLPGWLANQPCVHYSLGRDADWDRRVLGWIDAVRGQLRTGVSVPPSISDVALPIAEMRLFKDAHDLSRLRQAGQISAAAHVRAMQASRPGRREYEIEAELLHTFVSHGARSPAYESIVAGGANACVLHYVSNRDRLRDGDLLLIDAGCELDGYAGDITRTFPVNGRFSGEQRAVYDIVLAAQLAAIDAIQPGVPWNAPADAALAVLVQGLIDLGLLSGSVAGNIESEAYRQFYMHRIGHWLGLDVHDVGLYKLDGQWRSLLPGMVTTVEPGLYIRPAANVPERFAGIGIRIEDDVLVTDTGPEVLSADAPKHPDAIEALMAAAQAGVHP